MIDPKYLSALEASKGLAGTPANITRLAKTFGDEAARWAVGQWDLRVRAKVKFALSDQMLFVKEALEQATHERVATYHASLFPTGEVVADLTTGIGGDLVALAGRGPTVGFDLDADRLEYAAHNLAVHQRESELIHGDGLVGLGESKVQFAFCDPSRRVDGRRTNHLDEFSPDPRAVSSRFQSLRLGVMKLSPMLSDSDLDALGPRVEFISFGGECREALAISGTEAQPGRFVAQVDSGESLESSESVFTNREQPDEFLFDSDPAAVRGHALGTLADRYGLAGLGDSPGYLTGPEAVRSPWLRTYQVLYHGKADLKATRAELRRLGAATPELKQRGAGLDLIAERKRYLSEGTRTVSLVIWKVGKSLRHAVVERVV